MKLSATDKDWTTFFSHDLIRMYKQYVFILWFNRFAFALNCFMAVFNFYTHHYWTVPISLGAVGLVTYCLRVTIPNLKSTLIRFARVEVRMHLVEWGASPWGSDGMPELKRAKPIFKKLN